MYKHLVSNQGLWLVDHRMSELRCKILQEYIDTYFEPIIEKFSELKGLVHLSLRNEGFFFRTYPYYEIVVNSKRLPDLSAERLRFVTAYMLAYFSLHARGQRIIVTNQCEKYYEQCAMFLAFSRGYAEDYLLCLTRECSRQYCDFKSRVNAFKCSEILPFPCKSTNFPSISQLAAAFKCEALRYDYYQPINFNDAIKRVWAQL